MTEISSCGGCPDCTGKVIPGTRRIGDLWAGVLEDAAGRIIWAGRWMPDRDRARAMSERLVERWKARAIEVAQRRAGEYVES